MLSFSRSRRQSARRRRSHRGWNHGDNSEKAPVSEDKGFHPQHATSDVFYSQETSDTTKTIHRCSASNIRHRGCKPTTPAQGRNVNDLFTTKNAYKNAPACLSLSTALDLCQGNGWSGHCRRHHPHVIGPDNMLAYGICPSYRTLSSKSSSTAALEQERVPESKGTSAEAVQEHKDSGRNCTVIATDEYCISRI